MTALAGPKETFPQPEEPEFVEVRRWLRACHEALPVSCPSLLHMVLHHKFSKN